MPDIVCVVTKREISRNEAEFRDNGELLADISNEIVKAVQKQISPKPLEFPARFEKSYKRVEDAAIYLKRLSERGISAEYLKDDILGRDAHTVVTAVHDIAELVACI